MLSAARQHSLAAWMRSPALSYSYLNRIGIAHEIIGILNADASTRASTGPLGIHLLRGALRRRNE